MSQSRLAVLLGALAVTAPLLAGCAGPSSPANGRVSVVTSFYPLQYVARRIAGGHADVANLTHPGQEPHDIELTVPQTAELADADLVVYEKGFQASVDQAVEQNGPAHVVDAAVSAGLSGDDPHFWQDPTRLSAVAGAVESQLAAVDPPHAADYRRNLAGLQGDLAALDRSYRAGLASCRITTIVVSHDAFSYLGRRYGLKVVGINGLSPDAEPSPAHIRTLQDLIRSDGITTVFSEQLASRKFANSLAGDLGITAAVLDPIEGLSDATADQDYLSLMRRNLRTLRKGDDCS
ncbi:MAG: metal ABC transporter substrate-binding protein [Nocardioidaceae bacterium]